MTTDTPPPPENVDLTAYARHWVALSLDGQVAGVGLTPVEAAHQARHNRPRERFTLRYVEPPGGAPLSLPPLLQSLQPVLQQEDIPVYLVGGVVRDALLGRESHDLDFVVPANAIKLAFRVGNALGAPAYVLDKKRDTGRVMLPQAETMLDFARLRGPNLEADLRDRDFTINALAMPASARTTASLIDPLNGWADLRARRIRHASPQALANDPVRTLRAARLAVRFGFHIEAETAAAVRQAAPLLDAISPERVRDELLKCLKTDAPADALRLLAALDLLPHTLPEIAALREVTQSRPHHEDVFAHTARVLRWLVRVEQVVVRHRPPNDMPPPTRQFLRQAGENAAPYVAQIQAHLDRAVTGALDGWQVLRWAGLFHDAGKAVTRTVEPDGRIRFFDHDSAGAALVEPRLRHLRFSNEAISHVQTIVAGHMRPLLFSQQGTVSRRAAYRFFRDVGPNGLDITLLSLADHLATYDGPPGHLESGREAGERLLRVVAQLHAHYFQQFEQSIQSPPLLNGRRLMQALHLPSGPEVGRLLRLIEEAQAAGEISTPEEALDLARRSRQ